MKIHENLRKSRGMVEHMVAPLEDLNVRNWTKATQKRGLGRGLRTAVRQTKNCPNFLTSNNRRVQERSSACLHCFAASIWSIETRCHSKTLPQDSLLLHSKPAEVFKLPPPAKILNLNSKTEIHVISVSGRGPGTIQIWIFNDFHRFSQILIDFHRLS